MTDEQLRMQMLSGIITEGEYKAKLQENAEKESLNESMIGGIVGIGSINQIPSTPKTDYETAFEHFLGERYETKFENREQDLKEEDTVEDMEERTEEEVNESWISPDNAVAYLENKLGYVWNMGTGKNTIDLQSLAQSIAQDLGLIEDLDENKKPGTAKERSAMAKKARAGKDIGEKGKNFEKIAKSAAKQYGSEEAGKKVAGAVMYGKLNK